MVGILLIGAVNSEPEVIGTVVSSIVQAIIYAVLGVMIRKGSITALWIAGVLFVLDTALLLLQSSGKGLGVGIVSRGILIYVLIRYIRRERISA